MSGFSGAARVAGVVGRPVAHSLSPLLHNRWIAAAGLDAVYVPMTTGEDGLHRLFEGFRGGVVAGLNVTLPFKAEALALADDADAAAEAAGAANLVLFHPDGRIIARNTDGAGLLAAFREQAPGTDLTAGPVVVLGAGGAAYGAVSALRRHGCPEVRIVNRTLSRAHDMAERFGGRAFAIDAAAEAFAGAVAIVNATAVGLTDQRDWPLASAPLPCAVMDMVYRPVMTPFLQAAAALGMPTVDGLSMLINQAIPSFEALFGRPPPAAIDVRAILLAAMEPPRRAGASV